jgi:hypothetical protein
MLFDHCSPYLPSLIESVSSLGKVPHDKDKVFDMGRYEYARVEFTAAPRCVIDVCPDSALTLPVRDKAGGNACRARQDRLMGLARFGRPIGARGLAATP